MKSVLTLAVAALFAAGPLALAEDAPVAKEGEKAPEFKLKGTDDKEYSLKDFVGKKAVVIAWFPKADTPGCTKECQSMKDNGERIRAFDVAYFAASVDPVEDNKKFVEKFGYDFPILSDPEKKVATAYGVVDEKQPRARRWTFFIDKDGVVRSIDKNVNTTAHGEDIAKKLEELKVAKKK